MTIYGYVYLTTNMVNGRVYVGQKTGSAIRSDYKGSGKTLIKAIKKYGFDNFELSVIEWCSNQAELDDAEIYHIAVLRARYGRRFCYNIADGGHGCSVPKGTKKTEPSPLRGRKQSSDHAEKSRKAALGMKMPESAKKAIADSKKGVQRSPEARAAMSAGWARRRQILSELNQSAQPDL